MAPSSSSKLTGVAIQ
ncbi:hypothetical protein ACOXOK_005055 [Escherichia coli]